MSLTNSTKKLINIISFCVIAIILVWFVFYTVQNNVGYKDKLELEKVVFYSDSNILEQISFLNDANKVVLYIDRSAESNVNFSPIILYAQIFSANKKGIILYQVDENSQCHISDFNTNKTIITTKKDCEDGLKEIPEPQIILGESNSDLQKTKVEIKDIGFYVTVISQDTSLEENRLVLEAIYSNLAEIEAQISAYVGNFSKDFKN